MEDLLAEFVAETREMLEAIEGELIAWEADPADSARLDAIFRFVHTVKGNCGFFDLPLLEQLSHAAESALGDVRSGTRTADSALVSAVLAIVDRIRAIADAIDSDTPYPECDDEALMAALEAVAETTVIDATAARPAGPAQSRATSPVSTRSIRLPVDLLDRVMSSASDLVLARNEMSRRVRAGGVDPAVTGAFERLSAILDTLRDDVTRMRMQRIELLFSSFPRLVRDLAGELGKQVAIDIEGGDAELDREMVELIRDPLTHIIRNALDHGIELPEQRRAAGKPERGLVHMSARQAGNRIIIAITDDGRGIDCERLIEKAVSAGIASASECAAMDKDAALALVFEPGLSTAQEVSTISGRGVGMDVVRANIEQLGGSISLSSEAGEGTRMLLSLPLTLSIVPALTLETGGQTFAMARSYVEEILRADAATHEIATMGDRSLITVRGQRITCVALSEILGLPAQGPIAQSTFVITRLAGGNLFALAVDRVIDHEELVIKPLPAAIMHSGLYVGSSLLDDGQPILMLDIAGIARAKGLISDVAKRASDDSATTTKREATQAEPALLVNGLDQRQRLVRLDDIIRIDKVGRDAVELNGNAAAVVLDERIVPLLGAGELASQASALTLLRLGRDQREFAFAIDRVIDTAAISHEIVAEEQPGEIEGVTLHEGRAVAILDTGWLAANFGRELAEIAR